MSVLVLLEMNAKSGSAADIKNWLRDELHHARGFDGCNSITVQSNQDDPNNMVIVEDWDSRQQYEKYLAWRVERGDIEKLMGWLGGEPSIRYYENVGVWFHRSLSKIRIDPSFILGPLGLGLSSAGVN